MDTSAPAVVAVVVTRDPGPWLEETLRALAGQDYPQLAVLVVAAGGTQDPTGRVGRVFPDAFVRRLDEPLGFGAAANEVLGVVEGAAFFLVCHDDCAPDASAVRLMVEESFRSNAGIVAPKMVSWDDPLVLLHVGMNADKTGAVVDRVQSPEIDAGQHDGVREVFVAPSGCMLIRADLMTELGGFDPGIVAMGEDLDLCWRAQLAGARVVVAPDARVRHLEVIASGVEPVLTGTDASTTLQALQRRHELRAVLKCYGAFYLLRVLPLALALGIGEALVALAARDRARARAVVNAWRWNFAHRTDLRAARHMVQRSRQVSDRQIRRNQLRGSARLSEYLSNVSHLGFEVTHARVGALGRDEEVEEPELTGSIAGAFSEDDSFDDWDDRGRFAPRGPRRSRVLATRRSRLIAALVIALLVVIGLRDLTSGALPAVGQFLPLSSWSGTWHQFFASWQPAGVGTTAPASPAFAALGALGTVLLGGMGLAEKVLVLGCIPVGAWGVSRLLAPLGSRRARLVGAASYLGIPLVYDALAHGRWDGMVAFALAPWVLSALMRATMLDPYDVGLGRHGRQPRRGQLLGLGVVLAIGIAFVPAMAVVALVCGVGLWLGSLLVRGDRGAGGAVRSAIGALAVALVLCAPWVIGTVLSGPHAVGVFGLPSAPSGSPGWTELLRFDVGPVGGSALSWLLPAAALLPLVIGAGPRLAWAGRLWSVALVSWGLAWAVSRGWTGSFAPSIDALLAPAAVALAACIGLGVAAFETDLFGHRFGWRQLVTSVMMMAALAGMIPIVAEVPNGSFGLPATGFNAPLQFLSARSPDSYRVLWLGDPDALPLGGWSAGPGLAYATTENGPPDAQSLFAPAAPGPATQLAGAVALARQGKTVHLGRLLAPAAIRYVVVIETLAPTVVGVQSAPSYPVPADLLAGLAQQADLRQIPGGEGFVVFTNTAALPERASRPGGPVLGRGATKGPAAGIALPAQGDLTGWRDALRGPSGSEGFFGAVESGTVYAAMAPGGDWQLSVDGTGAHASSAFGWGAQFEVAKGGSGALRFAGVPLAGLGGLVELLLWLVVVGVLIDRRFAIRARLRALAAARPGETTVRPTDRSTRTTEARQSAVGRHGRGATVR
ncbi:MAG TPA: glycosyltransferase [Acidimicrobiales bacterium]|nr:glycosyltransferase [Acidimicrobiales bacterium]